MTETNQQFTQYATSVAFSISLSKTQCNALLRVEKDVKDGLWMHDVGTMSPLERRGLVFWVRNDIGRAVSFGGLTEAGRLMCALLKEAGMTVESTNTGRILKRIEQEAA